jgi:hypothetical protein
VAAIGPVAAATPAAVATDIGNLCAAWFEAMRRGDFAAAWQVSDRILAAPPPDDQAGSWDARWPPGLGPVRRRVPTLLRHFGPDQGLYLIEWGAWPPQEVDMAEGKARLEIRYCVS